MECTYIDLAVTRGSFQAIFDLFLWGHGSPTIEYVVYSQKWREDTHV